MPNRYSIVASNHIDGAEAFVKTLATGVAAVLVREPDNQHDKNAIAVYVDGKKIGYIPKKQNTVLAQFMDQKGQNAILNGEPIEVAKAIMGMDNALKDVKIITATFVRSPNSGFPMVEV